MTLPFIIDAARLGVQGPLLSRAVNVSRAPASMIQSNVTCQMGPVTSYGSRSIVCQLAVDVAGDGASSRLPGPVEVLSQVIRTGAFDALAAGTATAVERRRRSRSDPCDLVHFEPSSVLFGPLDSSKLGAGRPVCETGRSPRL